MEAHTLYTNQPLYGLIPGPNAAVVSGDNCHRLWQKLFLTVETIIARHTDEKLHRLGVV